MRDLVYCVATTLDGFIARPDGCFAGFPSDDAFSAHLMEHSPETFPAPFRPPGFPCLGGRWGGSGGEDRRHRGGPEYQWTRPVGAARLPDGGFAVLEQVPAEVRGFDGAGLSVRRIGREGDGLGEFRSPLGLTALAGDTLLVWDRGSRFLSWFSIDGVLQREQLQTEPEGIPTIRHVALTPGGTPVVIGATSTEEELGNQGRVREVWQVVPVDPRGEAGEPLGAVPGTERAILVIGALSGGVAYGIGVLGSGLMGNGESVM